MIDLEPVCRFETLLGDVHMHHVVREILAGAEGINSRAEAPRSRKGRRGQHMTLEANRIPRLCRQ